MTFVTDPLLDHLDIPDEHRRLIAEACGSAKVVALRELDKGASGSSVYRARWDVGGVPTKEHVLKIGPHEKLRDELDAYEKVATAIDTGSPNMRLVPDENETTAVLIQEFVGGAGKHFASLRERIRAARGTAEAVEMIDRLYRDRMQRWHFVKGARYEMAEASYAACLDRYVARRDVQAATAKLGSEGLDRLLEERFALDVSALDTRSSEVANRDAELAVGPVHGDLHAQNVLIDDDGRAELIDFGWTTLDGWRAIDFLMLECSLKFLVSPASARIEDLLGLEQELDSPSPAWDEFEAIRVYGRELAKVGACVERVRQCALESEAVSDESAYRHGLVALTAGLTSLPYGLNGLFIVHSLAYHTKRLI